ncbi:mCG147609 [Mus musculus]|nr:mCG147609 [Mus musculus]
MWSLPNYINFLSLSYFHIQKEKKKNNGIYLLEILSDM